MGSANIGWMFYKEAFKKLENSNYPRDMKAVNGDILNAGLSEGYPFPNGTHHAIELKTTYPGLVIGSGYPHALKENKENFNFGFFFDHTTGMPIIPGSTVKGVLRSLFGQNKNERHKEQKEALIASLLPKKAQVAAIAKAIFEGINLDGTRQTPYKRDIFLDAYVIRIDSKLLSDDSITPHASPFKDPVPNKMLKLAPGVTIQFAFELHDTVDENGKVILSADEKEELFLSLLLWHGIGAKTNVGYGQFVLSEEDNKDTPQSANQNRSTSSISHKNRLNKHNNQQASKKSESHTTAKRRHQNPWRKIKVVKKASEEK